MNVRNTLIVAVALSAVAGSAFAQNSASASATTAATLQRAITITKNNDLNFGRIVLGASGNSTVTVAAADGAVSVVGNAVAVASSGASRAQFTVTGEGAGTYSRTIDTCTLGGPSTLTPTCTLVADSGTLGTLSGTAGSLGSQVIGAGAAITISNTTPTGVYSGTLQLTVAYN